MTEIPSIFIFMSTIVLLSFSITLAMLLSEILRKKLSFLEKISNRLFYLRSAITFVFAGIATLIEIHSNTNLLYLFMLFVIMFLVYSSTWPATKCRDLSKKQKYTLCLKQIAVFLVLSFVFYSMFKF